MIFAQNKSGVELLTGLAGQAIEDGCSSCGYQVPDIVLCKQRVTDLTEDVEVATLVPTFCYLSINTHTLLSALGTAVGGIGLLYLWGKGKELFADGANV